MEEEEGVTVSDRGSTDDSPGKFENKEVLLAKG